MAFSAALACWLAAAAAFAGESILPEKAPSSTTRAESFVLKDSIDLASCRPRLDVRELVKLTFDGDAITSTRDLARLPSDGHRIVALQFLAEVCDRRGSAIQELVQYFTAPVKIELPERCEESSYYRDVGRTIFLGSFAPCANDIMSVLYHELTHVVVADKLMNELTIWDGASYCLAEAHDTSYRDPADGTIMNVMDSQSHVLRALDEGVADGVSLAFEPERTRLKKRLGHLRDEMRSDSWKKMSWSRKQSNEYFVAAVIADYLGTEPAPRRSRLLKLVAAGRAQPLNLQGLLRALADADPAEARGRLDGILNGLNAGWNSERDEVARLREREAR